MGMSKKTKAVVLSVLFWGSGQFFICKQRIKGILFFIIQAAFIAIELSTGYWMEYLQGAFTDFTIRLHGGFFTKGVWGLATLGEKAGAKSGDHSMMLLIGGLIATFALLFFIAVYIWNIRDAYKTADHIDKTGEYITTAAYTKEAGKKSFEYIVLAPVAVAMLFVVFLPILFTFLTAFTDYNKEHLPPANLIHWVGLANFKKLFDVPIWSSTFFSVLGWTVIWAICTTFSTYFLGMFQALILNNPLVKGKQIFRTIMILPWAIPQMISLLVFKSLLNSQFGPLNQLLLDLGLITERIQFLNDPFIAKVTVILVNLWLGFPIFMVMMLGVFANIDQSVYEAASVDGANKFTIFTKMTLPLVMQATAPLLVMNLAGNFNGFGAIYFLTDGGPANPSYQFAGSTDILISWIYKLTLNQQMYNMAAVMSILIFVIVGAVSYWNLRRTRSFKEV